MSGCQPYILPKFPENCDIKVILVRGGGCTHKNMLWHFLIQVKFWDFLILDAVAKCLKKICLFTKSDQFASYTSEGNNFYAIINLNISVA